MATTAQDTIYIPSINVSTINSATTTNGTAIQTCQESEFVLAILQYGTVTTAATQGAIKVQGSNDNSSWTDLYDIIATGGATPADGDDNKFYELSIDLRNKKHKYLRWSITTTGTPNFVVSGFFIGMGNKQVPPAATNANRLGRYAV